MLSLTEIQALSKTIARQAKQMVTDKGKSSLFFNKALLLLR
jgi:hypothetical protein